VYAQTPPEVPPTGEGATSATAAGPQGEPAHAPTAPTDEGGSPDSPNASPPPAATSPEPDAERLATLERRLAELEREASQRRASPSQEPKTDAAPAKQTWTFGGYGELLASTRFFNPDPKKTSGSYRQSELDLARISFFVDDALSDWLSFSAELEFEHGGTGTAREVEWDEFGEYETEIEKGGEVNLEQAYLEARLPAGFRLRAGHLLLPVGLTTNYHLPTLFAATRRPESESHLIPMVWHESGAELSYRARDLALRVQAVTGLDSTGFSSDHWIAGGTQRAFETPLINDVGLAFAADYTGLPGTLLGVAGYTSNTTRNRPKRELDDVNARVFLGDVHYRGQYGPLRTRALAMGGALTHAAELTAANASLSSALGAPQTPVGSAAYALFVEASLDVLGLARPSAATQRLDLFVRAEAYDTMWKAPKDLDNPLMERRVVTTGVAYFPHPRVVLKAEYLSRWINEARQWRLRQDEVNAALGFVL